MSLLFHSKEEAVFTSVDALLSAQTSMVGLPKPEQLVKLIEDLDAPFEARLVAASILGVIGDPRIPVEPHLTFVKGGTIEIGLDEEGVTRVVSEWSHVGVEADWIDKETPLYEVTLQDFLIGTYAVTNAQYKFFLADSGYDKRPRTWYLGAYPWDRRNHPVCGIDPEDADAYVEWLRQRTGRPFRLPTEAEWEHAAKGFEKYEYPWGNVFDPHKSNTRESGIHTTTPVGIYPLGRSPFGVYDMAGNVEEYVADEYRPYPCGRHIVDDLAATLGRYRVTRGGSFARFGDLTRTRRRHGNYPSPLYPIGFRVACEI